MERYQLDFKKGSKMKKVILFSFVFVASLLLSACNSFVQGIDPPINSVDDMLLNDVSQTNFIVTGVKGSFNDAFGQLSVYSSALSDELVFDRRVQGATFPEYDQMESGKILINNGSVEDGEGALGRLRLYADTLVARALKKITYKETAGDSASKKLALYTGYLYGGLARYMYAAYFGLEPENGGGVINLGPFIPSDQMYDLAIEKFNAALPNSASDYDKRVVHTLIARIKLIKGLYAEAASEAAMGLNNTDAPLSADFTTEVVNIWWVNAGSGRTQLRIDQRFVDYVTADPKESARIAFLQTGLSDPSDTTKLYRQDKYPEDKSSIPVLTWQENELILAEASIRAGNVPDGLLHVNNVRVSHNLDPATATNLDSIYVERDKELYCTGNRLIDQRRFDHWHLAAGTWKFLPITQRERVANSHLH